MAANTLSRIKALNVWWHEGERSVAENLAFDEALLARSEQLPTLRFYQWSRHHGVAWTMGYFQRLAEMPFTVESTTSDSQDLDVARRWTGGGLVCHQGDVPYTLTVPADHWLAKISATDCYRWIHDLLATSIRESTGINAVAQAVVSDELPASPARACFAEPVHWDVIVAENSADGSGSGSGSGSGGKKIAGAAQRRSRGRLLHQGSVILPAQEGSEPDGEAKLRWRQMFANALCEAADERWSPSEELIAHANDLVRTRYGNQRWQERF